MEENPGASARPPSRKPKYTKLTQQHLPACQPVLDPIWVIFIFLAISVVFIPIGGVCYAWGLKAQEVIYRYDNLLSSNDSHFCSATTLSPKDIQQRVWLSDAIGSTAGKTCSLKVTLNGTWQSPVYVYYQLEGFYQNHRRYHKSRSDSQLADTSKPDIKTCKPKEKYNNTPVLPCGLIAWSFFNDSFTVTNSFGGGGNKSDDMGLRIRADHIAPQADVKYRFANLWPSANFYPNKSSDRGGGNLTKPLKQDERFIIWMRTAALPRFRKLWGKIELPDGKDVENTTMVVEITNQYNSFSFGGSKSLVFATTTWLGGRTRFLGLGYLVTGGTSLLMATVYALLYLIKRPTMDESSLVTQETT